MPPCLIKAIKQEIRVSVTYFLHTCLENRSRNDELEGAKIGGRHCAKAVSPRTPDRLDGDVLVALPPGMLVVRRGNIDKGLFKGPKMTRWYG